MLRRTLLPLLLLLVCTWSTGCRLVSLVATTDGSEDRSGSTDTASTDTTSTDTTEDSPDATEDSADDTDDTDDGWDDEDD